VLLTFLTFKNFTSELQKYSCNHKDWAGHFLLPFVLQINATEICLCNLFELSSSLCDIQQTGLGSYSDTVISINWMCLTGFSYWIQSWTWIAVQIYKIVIVLILHKEFFWGLSLFQHQKLEMTIQMNSGLNFMLRKHKIHPFLEYQLVLTVLII